MSPSLSGRECWSTDFLLLNREACPSKSCWLQHNSRLKSMLWKIKLERNQVLSDIVKLLDQGSAIARSASRAALTNRNIMQVTCENFLVATFKKKEDFPGAPVVKTLCSQCRGPQFDAWLLLLLSHFSRVRLCATP